MIYVEESMFLRPYQFPTPIFSRFMLPPQSCISQHDRTPWLWLAVFLDAALYISTAHHLYVPLCGIFAPNLGYVARYAPSSGTDRPQTVTSFAKTILKPALVYHQKINH